MLLGRTPMAAFIIFNATNCPHEIMLFAGGPIKLEENWFVFFILDNVMSAFSWKKIINQEDFIRE